MPEPENNVGIDIEYCTWNPAGFCFNNISIARYASTCHGFPVFWNIRNLLKFVYGAAIIRWHF